MTAKIKEQQPAICLIIYPRPTVPGMNIGFRRLIQILEPLAREIFLITGNFVFSNTSDSKIHLVNIKHGKTPKALLFRTISRFLTELKLSYQLTRIISKLDVIIFMDCPAPLLPMLTGHLFGKQIVFTTIGSVAQAIEQQYSGKFLGFILVSIASFLEELNYRLSNRIVVYSEDIIDYFGLNKYRSKIAIAQQYFLNTAKFKPKKQLKERGNVVGYIGRFSAEKGILNFLEAIPLVLQASNDVTFLITGDGRLRYEIEESLKKEGLTNKVKVTGWIPPAIIPDYLNELKLLVLPSYTEGLPNTMMEAMACGTPVLITPVGAIPDVIKDEATGFIMENNSPECIARNVIRALNYPNLDNIVQNALSLIEKHYTLEAAVEAYREVLSNL